MSENVVSMYGHPVAGVVNEEVVERLESLLDDARSGRIVAMMWVAALVDGSKMVGWTMTPDGYSLGPGLAVLNYRYGKQRCGDEE